jgi:peptidylprolyl isomerase
VAKTRSAAFAALRSEDVVLVATAADILADSLFRTPAGVDSLVAAAGRLRVPDDVEALQAVIGALGAAKDPRAAPVLLDMLRRQPDRSVTLAAADALQSITGRDYRSSLPRWIQPLWADYDWEYLRALPETLRVRIETIRGDIHCELYKSAAPFTVMTFLKLSERQGYFRGLNFHRVVPNFVIQGGDPRGDGWGGPGFSIRSEFSPTTYGTGVIGVASAGKDTEGSQFFIMHSPAPHLDGRYTVIGRVLEGQNVVDRIQVDDRLFDLRRGE